MAGILSVITSVTSSILAPVQSILPPPPAPPAPPTYTTFADYSAQCGKYGGFARYDDYGVAVQKAQVYVDNLRNTAEDFDRFKELAGMAGYWYDGDPSFPNTNDIVVNITHYTSNLEEYLFENVPSDPQKYYDDLDASQSLYHRRLIPVPLPRGFVTPQQVINLQKNITGLGLLLQALTLKYHRYHLTFTKIPIQSVH